MNRLYEQCSCTQQNSWIRFGLEKNVSDTLGALHGKNAKFAAAVLLPYHEKGVELDLQ